VGECEAQWGAEHPPCAFNELLGYPLKAGQIRRDKKELRSFLSRFAVVAFLSTGQKLQNIEELSHLVIQIQHDIADVVESIAK
jgi:hypothetical protein